ncbi:hypothetical protein [Halorussus lipolyticus]|uniref:hypothetical protein n=1 Tax=Halorussus lipolyticus TaxID=3034024 RepID=UPI0023E87621|nr:hypothetical protein [Halorussus sp. DT80]
MTEKQTSALEGSAVVRIIRWMRRLVGGDGRAGRSEFGTALTAVRTSLMARCVRTLGRWGREAAVYRWLTAGPKPDAATVDLRESRTLGPVVELFGRIPSDAFRTAVTLRVGRTTRASALADPVRAGLAVVSGALFASAIVAGNGVLGGLGLVSLAGSALAASERFDVAACLDGSASIRILAAVFAPAEPEE